MTHQTSWLERLQVYVVNIDQQQVLEGTFPSCKLVLHKCCVRILVVLNIMLHIVLQCRVAPDKLHCTMTCSTLLRTLNMWTQPLCKTRICF